MNPSVTVSRKIRVEIAHSTKVCSAVAGPYSPKLKETCHTTSVTRIASRARLEPKRYRFRIDTLNYSGTGSGGLLTKTREISRGLPLCRGLFGHRQTPEGCQPCRSTLRQYLASPVRLNSV